MQGPSGFAAVDVIRAAHTCRNRASSEETGMTTAQDQQDIYQHAYGRSIDCFRVARDRPARDAVERNTDPVMIQAALFRLETTHEGVATLRGYSFT